MHRVHVADPYPVDGDFAGLCCDVTLGAWVNMRSSLPYENGDKRFDVLCGDIMALFKAHFSLFHTLYVLRERLFEEGWTLDIFAFLRVV
ncbi:MAG: DNA-J related domain-containing protein [Myxococcota bacterium]